MRADSISLHSDLGAEDGGLFGGLEREHVFEHDHAYRLRGSEGRTMTTVGAFRVVPAGDLRDGQDKPLVPNVTAQMRARNRRVQFIILEKDGSPPLPGAAPAPGMALLAPNVTVPLARVVAPV